MSVSRHADKPQPECLCCCEHGVRPSLDSPAAARPYPVQSQRGCLIVHSLPTWPACTVVSSVLQRLIQPADPLSFGFPGKGNVSERNGDRARFQRERKRSIHRRARRRELQKALAQNRAAKAAKGDSH